MPAGPGRSVPRPAGADRRRLSPGLRVLPHRREHRHSRQDRHPVTPPAANDTPSTDRSDRPERLRRRHGARIGELLEREPVWAQDFTDLSYEGRRLFSEFFGTFLLVTVGAGGAIIDDLTHGGLGRVAAVTAPGLLVLAVILFMGAVSGAHLNPAVTLAFAMRGDFQWRRVPGYIVAQLVGAVGACALLRVAFGLHDHLGATLPGAGFTSGQAFFVETLLTVGLVSTILGTASTAQTSAPCLLSESVPTSCWQACGPARSAARR